jgi:hypothetical protein
MAHTYKEQRKKYPEFNNQSGAGKEKDRKQIQKVKEARKSKFVR